MKRFAHARRSVQALVLVGICCSAASGFADDESPATFEEAPPLQNHDTAEPAARTEAAPDLVNPAIALKGLVWRTKPGIVFLKTPVGLLSLSSRTTLKDMLASQEVTFQVHDASLAVDIRKRSDGSLVHRYLSGPFKHSDGDEKTLLRWTPDGHKSFDVGPHERVLSALREGTPVTVEVDDADAVLGVHDLQFDLQISQLPGEGSPAHLLLTGTITKLKSNFIFLRTPIGVVNVNAKIGIKHAQVGQTLTLHIHGQHLVADLAAPNSASARRFVTGPLEFASSDHESVRFWTPEGQRVYPTDRGRTALAGLREGHPITVELNGSGHVVEFHRLN